MLSSELNFVSNGKKHYLGPNHKNAYFFKKSYSWSFLYKVRLDTPKILAASVFSFITDFKLLRYPACRTSFS